MKLIDLHCDTLDLLTSTSSNENLRKNSLSVDLEGLQKSKVFGQFFACFLDKKAYIGVDPYEEAYQHMLAMVERFHIEIGETKGQMRQALSYADMLENDKNNIVSAILTVEEGGIINGKIERVDALYQLGVRLITLTWNYANCIGYANSSEYENNQKGLTPFGIEVIERMNEKSMIIDVSHLSDGGFWEILKISKQPIIASHSNARQICSHPRNLTDEMLKALGNQGGVTGINFCGHFLNGTNDSKIEDMVRHIQHIVRVGGSDVVALGTDFDGIDSNLEIAGSGDMDLLADALLKAGLGNEFLEKIWYKNASRVIKEVIK